jgi:hypothetical protein
MPPGDDKTSWLPLIRETFAGVIALVFAATFLILVSAAYQHHGDEKAFNAIKELITIVNGVVGIIVGYYFSRMTTEARAEKAEVTAGKAADAAANATQRERETNAELARLTDAAKEVLPTDPSGEPRKNALGGVQTEPVTITRLRTAVREAERALQRR